MSSVPCLPWCLSAQGTEYRGGGVSARSDPIIIGQDPEVPVHRASQAKYDKKYL